MDLHNLLYKLESNIDNFEIENTSVSKSTIGWQIDHTLRVVNGVITQVKISNPDEYKSSFNFKRFVVFSINKIPRGKARAPKSVQATGIINKSELISQIEIAKKLVSEVYNFNEKSNFKHHYFGVLNLKQCIKFLEIHTNHHLKIIDDVLKK